MVAVVGEKDATVFAIDAVHERKRKLTNMDSANEEGPWVEYIGTKAQTIEIVNRRDLAGLAGVLGYPIPLKEGRHVLPWPDNDVPPFAHWLNANPNVTRSKLGADGHPALGGFIPKFAFPRRMWAGSQVTVYAAYGIDQPVTHRKSIESITPKNGRSGNMIFLTMLHEFYVDTQLLVREVQNLVYREKSTSAATIPDVMTAAEVNALFDYDWCETITPDPVWLFQYSAVSFNGHRIHYDRDYATQQEHYPGLLVQGPLCATLLLNLYQKNNPDKRITAFDCRVVAPIYDNADFFIFGAATEAGADLWVAGPDGQQCMTVFVRAEK